MMAVTKEEEDRKLEVSNKHFFSNFDTKNPLSISRPLKFNNNLTCDKTCFSKPAPDKILFIWEKEIFNLQCNAKSTPLFA